MQICATLVCNTKNSDEQSIICVNYVLRFVCYHHKRQINYYDYFLSGIIPIILSGSQYSSVVMASEQVGGHLDNWTMMMRNNSDADEIDQVDDDANNKSDRDVVSQVDQPQMQIKSDHSDDDQGGTRNGSPESVKGDCQS